jgi:hypothetical protein
MNYSIPSKILQRKSGGGWPIASFNAAQSSGRFGSKADIEPTSQFVTRRGSCAAPDEDSDSFVLIADADPLAQVRVPLPAGPGAAGATQAGNSYECSKTSAAPSTGAAANKRTATDCTTGHRQGSHRQRNGHQRHSRHRHERTHRRNRRTRRRRHDRTRTRRSRRRVQL